MIQKRVGEPIEVCMADEVTWRRAVITELRDDNTFRFLYLDGGGEKFGGVGGGGDIEMLDDSTYYRKADARIERGARIAITVVPRGAVMTEHATIVSVVEEVPAEYVVTYRSDACAIGRTWAYKSYVEADRLAFVHSTHRLLGTYDVDFLLKNAPAQLAAVEPQSHPLSKVLFARTYSLELDDARARAADLADKLGAAKAALVEAYKQQDRTQAKLDYLAAALGPTKFRAIMSRFKP